MKQTNKKKKNLSTDLIFIFTYFIDFFSVVLFLMFDIKIFENYLLHSGNRWKKKIPEFPVIETLIVSANLHSGFSSVFTNQ